MTTLSSQKPYLLRALYEWMADNHLTPYVVIAEPTAKGHVSGVPAHLLTQETLTLNISPTATKDLHISNEMLQFHTRFGGQSHQVWIAVAAIVAIFDRDSQQGMSFAREALTEETVPAEQDKSSAASPKSDKAASKPSHLKIVK